MLKRATVFALAAAVLCAASAHAQSAPELEGSWIVTVALPDPPPGFPASFTALETYSRGGGLVTSNDLAQVSRPGQGQWERLGGQGFAVTILFFTFDSSGQPSGSILVRHQLSIDSATTYGGQGTAEFRDLAGETLFTVRFTSAGLRFNE